MGERAWAGGEDRAVLQIGKRLMATRGVARERSRGDAANDLQYRSVEHGDEGVRACDGGGAKNRAREEPGDSRAANEAAGTRGRTLVAREPRCIEQA